ncbi:MAG: SpoIIE family protein phosphatase [Acidobacteriota bacterium]
MRDSSLKNTSLPLLRTIPLDVKTSVLVRIFEDIHSAPDLDRLLRNMNRMIREELACDALLISIYDPYREELSYFRPDRRTMETGLKLKLGEGLAGAVALSRTPVRISEIDPYPLSKIIYDAQHIKFRQILVCPLERRGTLLGILEVFFKNPPAPGPVDLLQYLTVLAFQMGMGINYFKMSEHTERISLQEQKLAEVAQRISVSLDLDELLDLIIDSLRSLLPFDAAGIYLRARDSDRIKRMVVYGYSSDLHQEKILNVGQNAMKLVEKTGSAAILKDLTLYPVDVNARSSTRCVMVSPIVSNNRTIGVFTFESDEPDVYTRDDLVLFQKFAQQAALSIEKARLHQALLEKNTLEQEINIARQIQLSFLPDKEPPIRGVEVAGLNLPSRLVSGDYYDFIPIVDGQWGLLISDVSGKGIPASLIMASFRASMLAEIRNNYAIATIMSKVNKLLWESTDEDQFVTAFYAVLNESERVLTYCNAGHNPPLLIRADGRSLSLETGGLILGAFLNSTYQEARVEVSPGDVLLMYTDGVTEIFDSQGQEFGVERLVALVRESRHLSAKEIMGTVRSRILEFSGGLGVQDDFTLVVAKADTL